MAKRNTKRKSKRRTKRMRGGSDFNVPIRAFYPQNSFEHDPSRDMQTSLIKGGKKHSRKYLNQRKRFSKKMRGGLHLTYTYGREYNDSSEDDTETKNILREILNTDRLYRNRNLSDERKEEIVNNTINALRNLRDQNGEPTNNLNRYKQSPSTMYEISLINYLFPQYNLSVYRQSGSTTDIDNILREIPEPTDRTNNIIIDYEMMTDNTKNFYISETSNIFKTLFKDRTSFINKKPFFKYLNLSSEPPAFDAGIDAGGLTTHVFSLLSDFFTGSSISCSASSTSASSTLKRYSDYFTEFNGFYILTNTEGKLSSKRRDKLYFIGQLFASAIQLRQIIEINLHPLLLYQMLHSDFDSITPEKILEIIEKFGLSDTHPFSCFKTPITDQNCDYDEMGDIITDKSEEAMKFLKSKIDNPSVKAFVSGFQNIIDVKILNRLPLNKFSELISGSDIKLNYDNLMKHLKFEGFATPESDAIKDLIKEKSDSDSNWVRAFLFAITNKNKIPITGFPSYKPLRIVLKSLGTEQPPFIVHTCSNTMDLNKNALDEYVASSDKPETKLYNYFNIDTFKSIADHFNIS